jgi:hypothetical protein
VLVADFQIQFSLQSCTKTSIITPFKIVVLTDNKVLESEIKKTYPEFLYHRILTPQENLRYIEMQNFILKRANQLNMAQLTEEYFLSNKWLFPLNQSHIKTKLTKANSKYWTNPNYPYLELEGTIEIDMVKAFDYYYKMNFLSL